MDENKDMEIRDISRIFEETVKAENARRKAMRIRLCGIAAKVRATAAKLAPQILPIPRWTE